MEIGEIKTLDTLLYRDWDKVIVDAGSAGNVSIRAKNGQLLIMADPEMPIIRFRPKTNPEHGAEVFPVAEDVGELTLRLDNKVDYVLCVGPDPQEALQIASECETMLKRGGKMFVILDTRSNARNEVDPAIRDIQDRYKGTIYRVDVRRGNPNGIVRSISHLDAHIQSGVIIDEAKVVIVERRH